MEKFRARMLRHPAPFRPPNDGAARPQNAHPDYREGRFVYRIIFSAAEPGEAVFVSMVRLRTAGISHRTDFVRNMRCKILGRRSFLSAPLDGRPTRRMRVDSSHVSRTKNTGTR